MISRDINIAIVGATGAAGGTALKLLLEREHPADKITLMASSRSVGRKIQYGDTHITISEATSDGFNGIDVAIFAAGGLVSRRLAPTIAIFISLLIIFVIEAQRYRS
jgi:aspartate-semialdehyde dehydrogenase